MADVQLTAYNTQGNQNKYKITQANGNLTDIFYITLNNTKSYRINIIFQNYPINAYIFEKNVATDTVWIFKETVSQNEVYETIKFEIATIGFKFSQLPQGNYEMDIIVFEL